MSRVTVSPRVLHWAMERSDLTPADLEPALPKIRQWLAGESLPTLRQLEALAKRTLTPLGALFLDEPPEDRLPIPHFRTLDDSGPVRPSAELVATIRAMQRRQDWLRDYLIHQGEAPLPFVGTADPGEPAAVVAERMRSALAMEADWASEQPDWESALRALRRTIEDAGIIVVVNGIVANNTSRKLSVDEFRGFVLVDDYAPLAFVNGGDARAAQMFTLAHELAHVFMGSSAAFDLRQMQPAGNPIEQACNGAAAEFLVPQTRLREMWSGVQRDGGRLRTLARRFRVSEIVIARRALDCGLLSWGDFMAFYSEYVERERHARSRRSGGGDFYTNQDQRVGRRFASAVARAVEREDLLYSEAYQLTDLYGRVFDKYVSRIADEGAD